MVPGILTRTNSPGLDPKQFARLAAEVAALVRAGHQCVAVSSGAVAAGMKALSLTERPTDLATAQASAAIGQSKLMRAYETAFARYRLNVAQLLLTHGDLDSQMRRTNAKSTLERLLAVGNVVPIINENDSVAVELKFGDNDLLSVDVAVLAGADLLILLTQVDGLLDGQGKIVRRGARYRAGERPGQRRERAILGWRNDFQLDAVQRAIDAGITTAIINGRQPGRIATVVAGEAAGTHFVTKKRSRASQAR